MLSCIIPARNEPYLKQTIQDLLDKCTGEIEIIIILDGYWSKTSDIVTDKRVNYVHFEEPRGMRNGINIGVSLARGDYIMKCDAHCMFEKGFDEIILKDIKDNWVVVPRRYPLDVEKWEIEKRTDDKYPIDYEYIDYHDLHGVQWIERRNKNKDIMIDETMTAQGSCWIMSKKHFENIEGLDEKAYGSFFLEFQEISFKTWLSGGAVMVNKNTWYAHWHKIGGRGYNLNPGERELAVDFMSKWRSDSAWSKQTVKFEDMIKRFPNIPTWPKQ
jgi:glycosyltransferase involved in cell wall biosynthesis